MLGSVLVASDHGGFELRQRLGGHLKKRGFSVLDLGVAEGETADYPAVAESACEVFLSERKHKFGVLLCGTGIGISIAANRFAGVRCAPVFDAFTARMAKEHNDANFLAFGGRNRYPHQPESILDAFLDASFSGEDRHLRRLSRLESLSKEGRFL